MQYSQCDFRRAHQASLGLSCNQGRFDRMEKRVRHEAWMPNVGRFRTVPTFSVTNLSETMGEEHERVDIAQGRFMF